MGKYYWKLLLNLAIGLGLFFYTLGHFEVSQTLLLIQRANKGYLLVAFFLIVAAYLVRGRRWTIWERDLSYWNSFKLILIGFMGNNVLPARLGEILRAHCTAARTSSNFGRTAALASITIERILDGLIIAIFGTVGLFLVRVNDALFAGLMSVSLLFGVLTFGLLMSISFDKRVRKIVADINRVFPGQLTTFARDKINYFLDGLLLIKNIGLMLKAIIVTACIWGIELLSYYLIAQSVFGEISVETCLIFLAVVNFASLFPLTVGGIGAIEGAATGFLISAGVPDSEALAMVLIQHAYQYFFTTLVGGIFYFLDKVYLIPIVQRGPSPGITPDKEAKEINQGLLIPQRVQSELSVLIDKLKIEKRTKRDIELSIVIPGFNEQSRLPKTLSETLSWCHNNLKAYETIFVDDGSSDETLRVAKLFAEQIHNVKVIACPHSGKGGAVRMGMLNADGQYILFMDADGATPLSEIPKLLSKLREGYDVAVGSRVQQRAGEVTVKTPLHRKVIGRTFAALVNMFAVSGIADTQCGFKMFRAGIAREVFSRQRITGFAFDVEILYIARRLNCSIVEVPVNWFNQEGSKVSLVTDPMKMLLDVLRIRWLHRREAKKVRGDVAHNIHKYICSKLKS
jgi:dolichyl-phosphate beta-glucosyltransferase